MATHPQYQGRGLGQQLLRFAYDYARRRRGWAGLTLVPADEGLFHFYAKTDYQTAFYYQSVTWNGTTSSDEGAVSPITPEEYRRLRGTAAGRGRPSGPLLPFSPTWTGRSKAPAAGCSG